MEGEDEIFWKDVGSGTLSKYTKLACLFIFLETVTF